ncbi:MAG: hypothetical protein JWN04_95 [Myxococcaceae bacterium]|nr:hypothetical protein [Myxococcaceae bacterium]
MHLRKLVSSVAALSVLSLSGVSHAEATAPGTVTAPSSPATLVVSSSSDAQARTPLDTVRLRSGALFRGTLLEWEPSSHAVLQLHDGSIRRFEIAEIADVTSQTEAAPFAPRTERPVALERAATAMTPPALLPENHVRLTVMTSYEDALFVRGPGEESARRVCAGSCVASIPKGQYVLGLARADGEPLMAKTTTQIDRDMHVQGAIYSARAARIIGGSILGVGIPLGAFLLGSALRDRNGSACDGSNASECEKDVKAATMPRLATGAFVGLLSLVIGTFLLTRKHTVEFETYPTKVHPEPVASVPVEPTSEPQ